MQGALTVKLKATVPSWLRTIIQGAATVAVAEGVNELVHYEAGLPGNALIYIGAVAALYGAGITALEKKFPAWGWLLYLLPSDLPTVEAKDNTNKA
jgi:hypothetical protein